MPPLDEGSLRERFPEIPWDQPVEVHVLGPTMEIERVEDLVTARGAAITRWVCRYCISLHGVKAQDITAGNCPFAFASRDDALAHIELVHHD